MKGPSLGVSQVCAQISLPHVSKPVSSILENTGTYHSLHLPNTYHSLLY